jgi:intracellular septation protein
MNQKLKSLFSQKLLKHIFFSGLLEFGPVLLFIASYEHFRIYESTVILMVATIISTVVTYRIQKRIPYVALYVALLTIIFGSMTIHSHKVKFIQIRDTLYDLTAALTLIIGLRFNIPFFSLAFGDVIPMTEKAWEKLTYFWITFFVLLAINNEIARRILSLDHWFVLKTYVIVITTLFSLISLYFSYEEKMKEHE